MDTNNIEDRNKALTRGYLIEPVHDYTIHGGMKPHYDQVREALNYLKARKQKNK